MYNKKINTIKKYVVKVKELNSFRSVQIFQGDVQKFKVGLNKKS